MNRPLVIGHRGAPGYRPEHTLASYELALAQGVGAVEPDLVPSKDGVLVVRHEHDITATTDVSDHPEFADRRRMAPVGGRLVEGWFTEDFTWEELCTLRCRERIPQLRPQNTAWNGALPLLRFEDVLTLIAAHNRGRGFPVTVVAEIKDDTYARELGFDVPASAAKIAAQFSEVPVIWESFEKGALRRVREAGHPGALVYLLEREGIAPDEASREEPVPYPVEVDAEHIETLAAEFDGISPDVRMLIRRGKSRFGTSKGLAERAHAAGLGVLTWTLRPESAFLARSLRAETRSAYGNWRAWYQAVGSLGLDGIFTDTPDLLFDVLPGGVCAPDGHAWPSFAGLSSEVAGTLNGDA